MFNIQGVFHGKTARRKADYILSAQRDITPHSLHVSVLLSVALEQIYCNIIMYKNLDTLIRRDVRFEVLNAGSVTITST